MESNALKSLKVAIDGPAGAGKSTVAQAVAKWLGYLYIDTGAMYRAATWLALKKGIPITDGEAIAKAALEADIRLEPGDDSTGNRVRVYVDGEEVTQAIRSHEISDLVSPVSALSPLRKVMVAQQKQVAKRGGVVLDGRDIGTVVLPEAQVKVFLTASPEERARRRMRDQQALGEKPDFDSLLKAISERDHRDSTRQDSPLKKADDATQIGTDGMTVEEVVSIIISMVNEVAEKLEAAEITSCGG